MAIDKNYMECKHVRCLANFKGKCSLECCEGAIERLHANHASSPEEAAKFYAMSKRLFDTYFPEDECEESESKRRN